MAPLGGVVRALPIQGAGVLRFARIRVIGRRERIDRNGPLPASMPEVGAFLKH
jgi:hypothetical protein